MKLLTNSPPGSHVAAWIVALPVLLASGCATTPYQYGRFHPQEPTGIALQAIELDYGQPHKTLDRIAWVVGIPARIMTLNKKTNNHDISPETVETLKTYLEENDITDVYVAVNDYDPKGQWKRLRENDRIAPFWRYSMGTVTWLGYTVFPNRVFGGDRYNPYTNSLNLSSDVPALVLSEAAYAKDIHSRRHPGAYAAFVNDLPVLTVFRQARATSDVLGYARTKGDWKTEEQGYHVLYPQMGAATVGTAAPLVPTVGPFLGLGGAVAGHVTGRTVAYVQRSKLPKPSTEAIPNEDAPRSYDETTAAREIADKNSLPPTSKSPSRDRTGVFQASYEQPRPTRPESSPVTP